MKIHRDLLTEDRANQVWDPLRIAFALGFLTLLALEIAAVTVKNQPFDPLAFGTALGALIGGTGVGLWTSSKQADT